jgi:hypothetical protein
MIKSKALTFIACTLFAATVAFSGGKACRATQVSNKDKTECSEAFAKFNLAPDQKTYAQLKTECAQEHESKGTRS